MRSIAADRFQSSADIPIIASDVSDPSSASFSEFCQLISTAAVVATNRLHVGILAGMLGKPTIIKPASYHKILGIYNYSMRDMPHVELLEL